MKRSLIIILLIFLTTCTSREEKLFISVKEHNHKALTELLKQGTNPNTKDQKGRTPLHYAFQNNDRIASTLLLNKGADINAQDNDGRSPLHMYYLNNGFKEDKDKEIFILFCIKYNANFNLQDNQGQTIIHYSTKDSFLYNANKRSFRRKHENVYEKQRKLYYKKYLEVIQVNIKDKLGRTPLDIATPDDRLKFRQRFQMEGLVLGKDWSEHNYPLFDAVKKGDLHQVKSLVQKGADPYAFIMIWPPYATKLPLSPIDWASYLGYADIVKILIEKYLSTNKKSQKYIAGLYPATKRGHIKIVRYLLEKGADIMQREYNTERTPLHLAVEHNHLMIAKLLIDRGSKINLPSGMARVYKDGGTPLNIAVGNRNYDMVKMLISKGADVRNSTALITAMGVKHLKIAELLYQHGTNVNIPLIDHNKWVHSTPLHAAIQDVQLVKWLISKGANIHSFTSEGTPLHKAIQNKHVRIAKYLIQKDSDINTADKNNETVYHIAVQKGLIDIVKLLNKKGIDINLQNKWNEKALCMAIGYKQPEVAEFLIHKGIRLNCQERVPKGNTTLHLAARNGFLKIATTLIKKGLFIEIRNKYNQTPLHIAAEKGHIDMIKHLLSCKADVNAKDKSNQTPLDLCDKVSAMEILILAGGKRGRDLK